METVVLALVGIAMIIAIIRSRIILIDTIILIDELTERRLKHINVDLDKRIVEIRREQEKLREICLEIRREQSRVREREIIAEVRGSAIHGEQPWKGE